MLRAGAQLSPDRSGDCPPPAAVRHHLASDARATIRQFSSTCNETRWHGVRFAPRMAEPHHERRTLDPKLDVVFKMLFADEHNRALLVAFLTAVLAPPTPIRDVVVLNPELTRETLLEHGAVLDVRVRLHDGRLIDVEMQATGHAGFRNRILYYWAKGYGTQLGAGREYAELRPAVTVLVLDFRELTGHRYHSEFRVLEVHDSQLFSDDLVLHILELPKLLPPTPDAPTEPVVQWGRFFAAETDEELERVAMSSPDLMQAKNALDRLSAEPTVRELAEERRLARWNYERTLRLTHDEGKAEGKAEALIRLLGLKFGALESGAQERVGTATVAEVDVWFERLLRAESLSDVFDS